MCLFVFSDGGRCFSPYQREENDCSVRALAIATGTSYERAYYICEIKGRKCNSEFVLSRALYKKYFPGCKFSFYRTVLYLPIEKFIKRHKRGIFIIHTPDHFSTITNGIVIDIIKPTGEEPVDWWCEVIR